MYGEMIKASSRYWPMLAVLGLVLNICAGTAWATPSSEGLEITLPNSIYTTLSDPASLDRDLDGLKDDYENRLADAWRPYFIFDEGENKREQCHDVVTGVETVIDTVCVVAGCAAAAGIGCAISWVREAIEDACKVTHKIVSPVCKGNIDDNSLQPFEPVTLFQVRPMDGTTWPHHIKIKWGFLWRLDGGFRSSVYCTNYHYGDTQSGNYQLVSSDGITWALDKIDLWASGQEEATSGKISWTGPRSTYWGGMAPKPSPIVFASAGKHHQYISGDACENNAGFAGCDDDCGGGAKRLVNLAPTGTFTNVGEYKTHPNNLGTNNPFVNDLAPLGYLDEYVWWAKWNCKCEQALYEDKEGECFTGGMGIAWSASTAQRCDVVTPVYKLFDLSDPPVPPKQVGLLYTLIPTCY